MSTTRKFAAILCVTALAAGCSDANPALAPSSDAVRASVGAAVASEQATLNEIARAVALALGDQGLRQRIKNDMRHAAVIEHKLDVRAYLNGQSGGILLAKMAKETGRTREELLAMLGQVRPLEMYLPVPAHREGWTGGADLQVMGHLNASGEQATGFALDGSAVALTTREAPATPTLVIGQRETDFATVLDASHYENVRDKGGQSVGTYLMVNEYGEQTCTISNESGVLQSVSSKKSDSHLACGGGGYVGGGGGGSTPPPPPAPRYRTSQGYGLREIMKEYRQGHGLESWNQGSPEIYVEVTSHASMPGDPTRPLFTGRSRIGEGKNDDTDWHDARSPHLIQWNAEYGNYIHLKFYEQDGENFINFTITFEGKAYGIRIPDSNDDLGAWTYSFFDQALVSGIEGHGAGKFGSDTGSLKFISDYAAF